MLEPIENDLGLSSQSWDLAQNVFWKLLATYQGKPDEKWWSHIMNYEQEYFSDIFLTTVSYTRLKKRCHVKTV